MGGGSSLGRRSRDVVEMPPYDPSKRVSQWDKEADDVSTEGGYPSHYGQGVMPGTVGGARTGMQVYTSTGGGSSGGDRDVNQRKLYIGNIPHGCPGHALGAFIDDAIRRAIRPNVLDRLTGGLPPINECYVGGDGKNFGFCEFSTLDLAATMLQFDSVMMDGFTLRFKRPKSFQEQGAVGVPIHLDLASAGLIVGNQGSGSAGGGGSGGMGGGTGVEGISNIVPDGPNKIFIGGIPRHLTDVQVKELLATFGPLKGFNMIKDRATGTPKGFGFCEYQDPACTAAAVEGLNGLEIGDKALTVNYAGAGKGRAVPGGAPDISGMSSDDAAQALLASAFGGGGGGAYGSGAAYAAPPPLPALSTQDRVKDMQAVLAGLTPTCVVKLSDMVSAAEVEDDEEYRDIALDVMQECSSSGTVLGVIIPRNKDGYPGDLQGNIYVQFASPHVAHAAAMKLCGRKFSDKLISCDFIQEAIFDKWRNQFGLAN